MEELIKSSGLIVVEIAVVLIVIIAVFGTINMKKRKGRQQQAKDFVKKINANTTKRREKRMSMMKDVVSDYVNEEGELEEYLESELKNHVEGVLAKENSLYGKYIKILMNESGADVAEIQKHVEELVEVCHFKCVRSKGGEEELEDPTLAYQELVNSLKNEKEELLQTVARLQQANQQITKEYEIIYEKHEALVKQRAEN